MNDLTALHLNNAVFLCGLCSCGTSVASLASGACGSVTVEESALSCKFPKLWSPAPERVVSAGSKHDVNETEFVQRSALTLPSEGFC